jgi:DNA-binding HxlR family transcriptional regulator
VVWLLITTLTIATRMAPPIWKLASNSPAAYEAGKPGLLVLRWGWFDVRTDSSYVWVMDGSNGARVCSVTDALALVGDRYSLLVIREIAYGSRRSTELLEKIGCARDVLTTRLPTLDGVGIIERRLYSARPPRYDYDLTESGSELRPIVLALKEWGDLHLEPWQGAGHLRARLRRRVSRADGVCGVRARGRPCRVANHWRHERRIGTPW